MDERSRMIEESLKRAASEVDEALERVEDEAVASVALLSARAFIDVALLRITAAASEEASRIKGMRVIRSETP